MFKKILIPIDGSDVSPKVVLAAKSLAEKYGSEVTVLYVRDDTQKIPPPDDFELFQKVREIFSGTEIALITRIELGYPPKTIVKVATEEQAELIVIGNRGLGGLRSMFLGSVSKQVVNDAHCPVLVVK